jgi:hypothetical protein
VVVGENQQSIVLEDTMRFPPYGGEAFSEFLCIRALNVQF